MTGTPLQTLPLVDETYFTNGWMTDGQRRMAVIRLNTKTVMAFGDDDARRVWQRDLAEAFGEKDADRIVTDAMDAHDQDIRVYAGFPRR